MAQQYRDPEFVRAWVFGVGPGVPLDDRCLLPHPLASATGKHACSACPRAPPVAMASSAGLHDQRDGLNALYLSIPQIDAYRSSRGWVDKHAGAQPGTAFSLDMPAQVAWVVLSGKRPGTTVGDIYDGWAATASQWVVVEYAWLRHHADRAYAEVWNACGQPAPAALTEALQWLRVLTSMLHLTKH